MKKRYKHFQNLHQQLRLFRASLNIPLPTKSHREKRASLRGEAARGRLAAFPNKPEALVPVEDLEQRQQQLEQYLQSVLAVPLYRDHEDTLRFIEVSHVSFVRELGPKAKEGIVRKRAGSGTPGGCGCCGMSCIRPQLLWHELACGQWRERWLFLKDTCFGLMHPSNGDIAYVGLFDQGFEVSLGAYAAGPRRGLRLATSSRCLSLKCWSRRQAREWAQHLKDAAATGSSRAFTLSNEHGSFAPSRQGNNNLFINL